MLTGNRASTRRGRLPHDQAIMQDSLWSIYARAGNEQCSLFGKHVFLFVFVVLFAVWFVNVFGIMFGCVQRLVFDCVFFCLVFGSDVLLCLVFKVVMIYDVS